MPNDVALIEVYKPDTQRRTADVVFIHGLEDNGTSCWNSTSLGIVEWAVRSALRRSTAPKSKEHFWPSWLAVDFPTFGIWSLEYPVSASYWTGHAQNLEDRGLRVLDELCLTGLGKCPV